ncbi:MAG: hypothetical protein E2P05_03555 [Acidobacteria bacterium]|nr:MAG: hypothetical protein E2P05_03555 [Acidobacteriota bacterium]
MKNVVETSISKLVTVVVVAFITTTLLSASDQRQMGSPGEVETLEEELARFTERLTLSDEQVKQIQPILLEARREMSALLEDMHSRPPSSRSAMQSILRLMEALRKHTEQDLEEVLTKEQMEEYEKMQDEQRENMGGSKGGGGAVQSAPTIAGGEIERWE